MEYKYNIATPEDIDASDRLFNQELKNQIEGNLPVGHIYNLGYPGEILQAAGFPDNRIELSSTHLADKKQQKNHPFDLSDVKGLVKAINYPVAVFVYGAKSRAQNVIIEQEREGKKFLVGVHFNQMRDTTVISSVRGLFPKDNFEWLHWISQGKLLYVDKEKIQKIIDKQQINPAYVTYLDLDFVAKIVKNFENPKLLDEKNQNLNDIYEEFDDQEKTHLKLSAKQAIHDRITNSWQRSFTPDQVEVLNRYHQIVAPDAPANEAFSRLLDEVAQEPEAARKPEKWVTDTAKELDDLAEGITREESRGLHK